MSNKRKLRKAQARGGDAAPTAKGKSRDELRRQTAAERFKKPGSEKLWLAMLGWAPERQARIWLAQTIHDAAREKQRGHADSAKAREAFAKHHAAKLDDDSIAQAIDVWLASGDGYDAADPAPKWHFLANLAQKIGLGAATPEELQDDYEAWVSLELAGPWHNALLTILGQAEQAAIGLHGLTHSDRIQSLVTMTRAMWSALAYGDDASFELMQRSGNEWLASISNRLPARRSAEP